MTTTTKSVISSLIENNLKINDAFNIKNDDKLQQQHYLIKQNEDLEGIHHPKIKKFLKTYHSSSNHSKNILGSNSLNSNNYQLQMHRKLLEQSNYDGDDWSAPPVNSLIKGSNSLASSSNDGEHLERCETLLHGERITCFIVGGEKRLCLPQMLNYVLKDFTVQEINSVCEKLHIYCSRCSPEQLNSLKINNILPTSAPSCGLITLSDAERLCHKLLSSYISKHKSKSSLMISTSDEQQENRIQLKVYHCCFGRAYGLIHPHLYTNQNSQCIECENCHQLFSTQNFVVHAHRNDESRICHWGFDSSNWRLYIKLVDSCREDSKYKQEFENFKNKFSNKRKSMNDEPSLTSTSGNYLFKNSNNESSSLFKKILKINDSTTIDNNDNCSNNNNNTEHKLLNDLLSKPIGNSNSSTNNNNSAIYSSTPKLISNIYNSISNSNNRNEMENLRKKYLDENIIKTKNDDLTISFEILLDNLQNEIDINLKSKEIRDRFSNSLVRIKSAYNENLFKLVKNGFELQESKRNIELENDMLKTRIKYLELDNQCLKNQLTQQLNKSSIILQQQQQQQQSPPSSSSSLSPYGQQTSQFLKYYQQNFNQSTTSSSNTESQLNDTTISTHDTSSSIEGSSPSKLTTIENASSPQQQAAAIALISLHSPPSLSSTPKKQQNKNSTSPSYNINNNNVFIKCEQTSS